MTMEKSLEESMYQSILRDDQESVSVLMARGANPNKVTSHGKTCLGEAVNIGNLSVVKLLVDTKPPPPFSKKRSTKSQKRKFRHNSHNEDTVIKYKNLSDRSLRNYQLDKDSNSNDRNQGYYVVIHSEGSSSDESRLNSLKSPTSPISLPSTPLADLEWDEEIGNIAPTTKEDETWSSMYRWYASILESTGAAIASASNVTYGVDQQDAFMRTALHYAAEQGHTGIVKILIDSGCKIDVPAGDGLTALHIAAMRNHYEIVKHLLVAGSNVNYKTHEKMTSLHFAASRGFLEIVKVLVSKGAKLEARDTNERTSLYLASGRGHLDVVKYLICSGANVNGEEIHGYTPLCEAVWHRYKDVVEVLLSSGARITHSHKLLHNAIMQRQEEIVTMMANLGGGINLHNDNGDTPLLLAARISQPSIARILLENGANANACNSITGASILHIAVEFIDCPKDFQDLLMYLLQYQIDMNAVALTGDTALNRALLLQRNHAAVLLIRHGADVNSCDVSSCGLDNLSIACQKRSSHLASILLKAGHHLPHLDANVSTLKQGTPKYVEYYICKQGLSLFDLCRIKIRNMCKNIPLFSYVNSLPLPKSLMRLLMLEDEGCVDVSCIFIENPRVFKS
ncbi:ankyrin-3-like [Aricia agestis]|uniref:ankyrin-3-like n=1 Tax=Aricia agestis TaxID=91739 RepID=UPI001C205504|nr:ankyrin-3-like [Aricia agestis]